MGGRGNAIGVGWIGDSRVTWGGGGGKRTPCKERKEEEWVSLRNLRESSGTLNIRKRPRLTKKKKKKKK